MYFDTHAHVDDVRFDEDRREMLEKCRQSGVSLIMNIGAHLESSRAAVALSEQYEEIYATVGFHPCDTYDLTEEHYAELEELAKHGKVKAIGEIGLDYHYEDTDKDKQFVAFRRQMALAEKLGLPVVIHSREATQDTLEILKEFPNVVGVVHSYSGSVETAKILLKMGFYLSFNGIVTFKNAHKAREVLATLPHDRVLIETDCPYLSPEPHRGERNDPSLVPFVAAKVAEIWGMAPEDVAAITYENGKRFYKI